MGIRIGRRAALLGAGGLFAAPALRAQAMHRVRFTLDWTFHGSYAFAAAGERNGIIGLYGQIELEAHAIIAAVTTPASSVGRSPRAGQVNSRRRTVITVSPELT